MTPNATLSLLPTKRPKTNRKKQLCEFRFVATAATLVALNTKSIPDRLPTQLFR